MTLARTNFNTAYINYKEVNKGKAYEKTLVNSLYSDNTDFKIGKIDVSSSEVSNSFVYPAKPGYVLLIDSQTQEKK